MHTSAEFMDELTTDSHRRQIRAFIPIVLIIVVLAALFSLNNSSSQAGERFNQISALDSAGASTGSGGCWTTQAQVDAAKANHDANPNILTWAIWQNALNGLCTPRELNPPITLDDCDNPRLTVAIMIDRSSSLIDDGSPAIPAEYKQQIYTLVNEFYNRFNPRNGEVNFLLYAFGTKAVLQNHTTDGLTPDATFLGNLRTDASTVSGRDNLLDAISRIHFRNDDDYPNKNNNNVSGFQQRNNSPYQQQRRYDRGSTGSPGEYGKTNWQDAFVSVMNAASSDRYWNQPQGDGIDLAVMITDGLPTADNGFDWTWTPGTFRGSDTNSYSPSGNGIDLSVASDVVSWNDRANPSDSLYHNQVDDLYRITTEAGGKESAKKAIDILRSGRNPNSVYGGAAANIRARNPISVKGIVISTSSDAAIRNKSENYAEQVFGANNFFFATNFTTVLEDQVKSLVTNVFKESNCPELNEPVLPSLEVIVNNTNPTIVEGDTEVIQISVRNNTDNAAMDNVTLYLCNTISPAMNEDGELIGCSQLHNFGTVGSSGESAQYPYSINLDLGETIDSLYFVAVGTPALGFGQTWDGLFNPASETVDVVEVRRELPA